MDGTWLITWFRHVEALVRGVGGGETFTNPSADSVSATAVPPHVSGDSGHRKKEVNKSVESTPTCPSTLDR